MRTAEDGRSRSGPGQQAGTTVLDEGTRLGRYTIGRLVGLGSMGAVYEGVRTDTGGRVAIKVLSPGLAAMPAARARFLKEAKLTGRVRHPHVVGVIEVSEDAGYSYFVMDFLDGEDLARRLARCGPLSVEETAEIMVPVCDAVASAHRHGITHRDLKPSNIFLATRDSDGQRVHPVVLDFGIAKDEHGEGAGEPSVRRTVFGTPYYLAPEQVADHRAAGAASDQYALGVILYECLTGKPPFAGDSAEEVFQAIAAGNPVPPSVRRPDLPASVDAVVLRALSREPKDRFTWVAALRRALQPFATRAAGATVAPVAPAVAPPSPAALTVIGSAPSLAALTVIGSAPSLAESTEAAPTPASRVTAAPAVAPATSPAIAVEAATRSPFVRTLTPEVEELSGPWFAAGEAMHESSGATPLPPPVDADAAPDAGPAPSEEPEAAPAAVPARWRKIVSNRVWMGAAAGVALSSLVLALVVARRGSSAPQPPLVIPPAAAAAVEPPAPAPGEAPAGVVPAPVPGEAPVAAAPAPVPAEAPVAAAPAPPSEAPPPVAANEAPAVAPSAPGEAPVAAPVPSEAPAAAPEPAPVVARREPRAPAAKEEPVAAAAAPRARKSADRPRARTAAGVRMHNGVPLLD